MSETKSVKILHRYTGAVIGEEPDEALDATDDAR
jgi:hypothetical protein